MLTGLWHIDNSGHVIQYPKWNPGPDVLDQQIGEVDIGEAREWIEKNEEFLELKLFLKKNDSDIPKASKNDGEPDNFKYRFRCWRVKKRSC